MGYGWRRMGKLLGLAVMVLMVAACVREPDEKPEQPLQTGDALPEFSLEVDGQTVTRGSLLGKPSVVVFFRLSCPDCREELPHLQQLYEKYYPEGGGVADGQITLLTISYKDTPQEIAAYWSSNGLTLPYGVMTDKADYERFELTAVPTVHVSDRNGVIRHITRDNPIATFEELDGWVANLLKE